MTKKPLAPIVGPLVRSIISPWIKDSKGIENLPKKGGFILAPNHSSYFEHLMIGSIIVTSLNRKIHFIAKKEHFEGRVQPLWHSIWKKYVTYIPIDRSRGDDALRVALDHLNNDAIIVIYPEGTRSPNGKIQRGKSGVARLGHWSGKPIVPVGFKGTFKVLPKGAILPRPYRASISFGKPIKLKKTDDLTKTLLRRSTERIMRTIAQLSGQSYEPKELS